MGVLAMRKYVYEIAEATSGKWRESNVSWYSWVERSLKCKSCGDVRGRAGSRAALDVFLRRKPPRTCIQAVGACSIVVVHQSLAAVLGKIRGSGPAGRVWISKWEGDWTDRGADDVSAICVHDYLAYAPRTLPSCCVCDERSVRDAKQIWRRVCQGCGAHISIAIQTARYVFEDYWRGADAVFDSAGIIVSESARARLEQACLPNIRFNPIHLVAGVSPFGATNAQLKGSRRASGPKTGSTISSAGALTGYRAVFRVDTWNPDGDLQPQALVAAPWWKSAMSRHGVCGRCGCMTEEAIGKQSALVGVTRASISRVRKQNDDWAIPEDQHGGDAVLAVRGSSFVVTHRSVIRALPRTVTKLLRLVPVRTTAAGKTLPDYIFLWSPVQVRLGSGKVAKVRECPACGGATPCREGVGVVPTVGDVGRTGVATDRQGRLFVSSAVADAVGRRKDLWIKSKEYEVFPMT